MQQATATYQIFATVEFDEAGTPVRLLVPPVGFDPDFLVGITVDGVDYDESGYGPAMPDEVADLLTKIGEVSSEMPVDIATAPSPCCGAEVTSTRICQGCADIVEMRDGVIPA